MRRACFLTFILLACSNPPAPLPPVEEDVTVEVADGAVDVPLDDVAATDLPEVMDESAATDVPDIVVPVGPPVTPLVRWTPAIVGKVLVTSDAVQLTAELLGNPPIVVDSWDQATRASSPVALPAGLLCWDIDGDGQLTLAKEDFDGDGQGTDADCALHPKGASPGAAGVVVALTRPDATCELRAFTLGGHPAWTAAFAVPCQQPAQTAGGLLVPTGSGAAGVVRLLDPRTGAEKAQIALPGPPVTPPAEIAPGRFAVGLQTAIATIGVQGGAATGIWLAEVRELSPDRPTALFGAGEGRVAATVWQLGDDDGALGRRIRVLDEDGTSRTIHMPGQLHALPVAGLLGTQWTILAAGARWVRGWRAATGAPAFAKETELGMVTGLALSGDAQIVVSETSWTGLPAMAPSAAWRVWSFDPLGTFQPMLLDEVAAGPVRWVSAAALLCDFLVVAVVPDEASPSSRYVKKSCSKGLAGDVWARPYGDNGNGGGFASLVDCAAGPGVAPCAASEGCKENLECDDSNPCTLDSCVSSTCSYKFLPSCCLTPADCEDFDPCTKSQCKEQKCHFVPSGACCESSSECDDGHPCTSDHCEQGFCESFPDPAIDGCCASDADCKSLSFCTVGVCDASSACFQAKVVGCCLYPGDCDDGSACTSEVCVLGACKYTPTPDSEGCCVTDADCPAKPGCTAVCNSASTCVYEDCCPYAFGCDDGSDCTLDTCVDGACTYPVLNKEGCCVTDADCPFQEGDPCTTSSMCLPSHECKYEGIQCDDQDICTNDKCKDSVCYYEPVPGCCASSADCPAPGTCMEAGCLDGVCTLGPKPGCCVTDADCEDSDPKSTAVCVDSQCQVTYCDAFEFTAEALPVDLVVVVDQSTSMSDKIDAVRDYLGDFAAWVTQAGIDYHVVLVAARYKGENALCVDPPLASENCKDSKTFIQIDQQVGSHDALQLVMDHIQPIEAFMRPQSSRQFLVISDDSSDVPYGAFDFFLDSRPGYDPYVFHGVLGFDTATCATGAGVDYATLAALTGGVSIDICSADWTASFAELGKSASAAGTSFVLSKPLGGALTVTYDGQALTEGTGYAYDAEKNRVELLAPLPATGKALSVCYPVK